MYINITSPTTAIHVLLLCYYQIFDQTTSHVNINYQIRIISIKNNIISCTEFKTRLICIHTMK